MGCLHTSPHSLTLRHQSSSRASQRLTSASASFGLSYGTFKPGKHATSQPRKLPRKGEENVSLTHHMTAPVDGGEREALRTARLADHLSVDGPFAQWERAKVILAVPLERESPRLVSNPVAYPVIGPDVDEHAYLAREQRTDVIRRTVEAVTGCIERQSDSSRTG